MSLASSALRSLALGAAVVLALGAPAVRAQTVPPDLDARVTAVLPQVVAWRRDIHEHPELGDHEVRTAALVAAELKRLGLDVRTGVARTGVVGVLRGGKPGGVIALRSELDALPVQEKTGLPFASRATATYNGAVVPVAHACGHDSHIAMLLGAARVLAAMKDQIPGTVVFLFQPAEEGSEGGIEGGAPLVIKQGGLDMPRPGAIFGLHVVPGPVGHVATRKGPLMAASDTLDIKLTGRGTHGAQPWGGVDLVNLSAAIVQALNVIAARQEDVTDSPNILTIGSLQAGTRFNVIPDQASLAGTLRTFTPARRADMKRRVERTVQDLADSYGASAKITWSGGNPPLINDAGLVDELGPALKAAAGPAGADLDTKWVTTAEDFAHYREVAPILFAHVGATPNFTDYASAPVNHSPQFTIDEAVLPVGVRLHVLVALTWLHDHAGAAAPKPR